MKTVLFFLLVFCSCFVFKAQITLINTGTTDNLFISVIDKKIILSGNNTLKRSNDDCISFTSLTIPEPGNFNTLTRVDTSICYMLSSSGLFSNRVYKSINGGLSWIQQCANTSDDLTGLQFFNATDGIGIISTYQLLKTSNSAMSWSYISCPASSPTAVKVFDDSLICVGDAFGSISLSKNRGATWPFGGGLYGNQAADIFFLSQDTIFAMSFYGDNGNFFVRTFDGGTTWQSKPLPLYNASHMYFKSANEGYVLGQDGNGNGIILKTNDLGQTWSRFNTNLNSLLFDMEFLNDSIALVSGTNSVLFKWNTKQTIFTGLKDLAKENIGINIYPNPVKDKLIMSFENKKSSDFKFNLINSLGQEVNVRPETVNSNMQFDLKNLQSGVYYLKTQSPETQKTFKIIKE